MRLQSFLPWILFCVLLSPWNASAKDVFVIVGTPGAEGQSTHGQAVLKQRLGVCMAITPWHLVEPYNSGASIHIVDSAGKSYEAHLKRRLEGDLAILEVVAGGETLCNRSPLSAPEDLNAVLEGWSPMRLKLRQQNGNRLQFPVTVQTFGDEIVEFTLQGNDDIIEGYSGGLVEAQEGVLAMLLFIEDGVGHAVRWDTLERATESFFIEMVDLDLSCSDSAPEIHVNAPTKLTEILPQWPRNESEWSISNIADRLRSAPRLLVSSRLEIDTTNTIPACSISLLPTGQLVIPAESEARLVTLSFENLGGEVISTGGAGQPAAAITVAGSEGKNYSRGGRKGCGKTKHGGRGGTGKEGLPGGDGQDAGSFRLASLKVAGPLQMSLIGGPGAVGGPGGPGGEGGDGAGATSGSSSAFDCKCGGNPGGRGGDGGPGGRGGKGGNGGNGGAATLILGTALDPASSILLKGGKGGTQGPGGPGGDGGDGGNRNGGTGFCSGQRGGSSGTSGPDGGLGDPGDPGDTLSPVIKLEQTENGHPDLEAFFYAALSDIGFGAEE